MAVSRDREEQGAPPEEDWFAPAPADDDWFFDEDEPPGAADEWLAPAAPPAPSRGRPGVAEPGHRLALALVVVVLGIILVAAGALLVRALGDDDGEAAATVPAATVPSATEPAATEPAATVPATTQASPIAVPQDVTLRSGAEGAEVEALQQALVQLGFDPGAIDGDYGAATEEAVTAFQVQAGLDEDGVAGPETLAALAAALSSG